MARSWRWLVTLQTLLLILGSLTVSSRASAQTKSNSAAILGLDSDDAERQADALTTALRSRGRAQPGWTISDNTDSIALVTAALRCPSHPDATCEKHIGEQLKTDRFLWGTVKKIGPGQLAAEVHYWQRGKPDSQVKEIFPESVVSASDPNLRAAASHIFEKLTGAGPLNGSVTIKAGDGEGAVIVDGEQKAALDHGSTKLDLPPGSHTIEVRASGFEPSKQTVNVVASNEALVTMTLVPVAAAPVVPHPDETAPPPEASHGKGRTILGLALIGLGVIAEGIAGYEGLSFLSNRSTWQDYSSQGCATGVPIGQTGTVSVSGKTIQVPGCGVPPGTHHDIACGKPGSPGAALQSQCDAYDSAKGAVAPAFIFASAGVVLAGAGIVVILTAPKNSEAPPPPSSQVGKPSFMPLIGPGIAGMSASITF